MPEALLYLDPDSKLNLQAQIRHKLVDGLIQGAGFGNREAGTVGITWASR